MRQQLEYIALLRVAVWTPQHAGPPRPPKRGPLPLADRPDGPPPPPASGGGGGNNEKVPPPGGPSASVAVAAGGDAGGGAPAAGGIGVGGPGAAVAHHDAGGGAPADAESEAGSIASRPVMDGGSERKRRRKP